MKEKFKIIKELFEFLKKEKKWWLIPIILFLFFLGFLVAVSHSSALAPFVYILF